MRMNNRGVIIFVYALIFILTALAGALVLRGTTEKTQSNRYSDSSQALWLADAGIQKAYWEYMSNNCAGFVQYGTATACTSCTCNNVAKTLAGTLTGTGDYDITLDSSNTTITAVGSVPSRTSGIKVTRSVQSTIGAAPLFSFAAFAQGSIEIANNATIDSYNSVTGVYGGSNIESNGDIGSNGTSAGIIHVDNNATVEGDVSTGSGGTVTVDHGASVTGTTTSSNNRTLTAVTVPSSLTSLASEGAYSVGINGTASLSSDHQYSAISLSNGSTLNISGNVSLYLSDTTTSITMGNNITINVPSGSSLTIYGKGAMTFNNNAVINNNAADPSKFLVYSTSTQPVTVENNGAFYGAIYAPSAPVEISNNAGFYGAVVGSTIAQENNGGIHYDENLLNLANPFGGSTLSNWQEY